MCHSTQLLILCPASYTEARAIALRQRSVGVSFLGQNPSVAHPLVTPLPIAFRIKSQSLSLTQGLPGPLCCLPLLRWHPQLSQWSVRALVHSTLRLPWGHLAPSLWLIAQHAAQAPASRQPSCPTWAVCAHSRACFGDLGTTHCSAWPGFLTQP